MDYSELMAGCDARHDALTIKKLDMEAALAELKNEQHRIQGEYRLLKRLQSEAAKAPAPPVEPPDTPAPADPVE